jgi:hypothetical protein
MKNIFNIIALIVFLTGMYACHRVQPEKIILLSVNPTPLLATTKRIEVTAKPFDNATLKWVSGTVKVFMAPTLPFTWNPDSKSWQFVYNIPGIVPPLESGKYTVKAWGRDKLGGLYEGELEVEVKR